jgi:hypothetical protein
MGRGGPPFVESDEASYVCGAEFTVYGGSSIGRYRGALPGKSGTRHRDHMKMASL